MNEHKIVCVVRIMITLSQLAPGMAVVLVVLVITLMIVMLLLKPRSRGHDDICFETTQAKILVLIITSTSNTRWQNEYQFYLDRVKNNFSNVTFKFVQCGKASEGPMHLTMDCYESFVPGILQKSALAIKKELKHFDFFVRTNLSTYVDCERLQTMIAKYESYDKPLYTGGLLFDWGISGTSIVINQKAAEILVSAYPRIKNMNVPDDVVIGTILSPYLDYTQDFEIMLWNFDLSTSANLRQFSLTKTPFIRLKPPNDMFEMQPIHDAISNLISLKNTFDNEAMKKIVAVSYSKNSSGGHALRQSILNVTLEQWNVLGFDVHVFSDCELQVGNLASVHVVKSPRHGRLGIPWEAIYALKTLGSKYDIIAYAEDDIFVPQKALDVWMQYRNRIDINVAFYRVETDQIHLTDGFVSSLGERVVVDGIPFVKLTNPYCGLWMMNNSSFQFYCQSHLSSWKKSQHTSPWSIRETAAAGLTHARTTLVLCDSAVVHMYPPNGFDCSKHFTVDDLKLLIHGAMPLSLPT